MNKKSAILKRFGGASNPFAFILLATATDPTFFPDADSPRKANMLSFTVVMMTNLRSSESFTPPWTLNAIFRPTPHRLIESCYANSALPFRDAGFFSPKILHPKWIP